MAEKIEPTKVQLISFKEKDSIKDFFNQNKVREFFNPYFKTPKEFQKLVQDVSTAYYKNKDLQKCKKEQILQSVIDCLNLGLTIDKREHAYLIPRKSKNYDYWTATLQIGWRGYIYKITQQYPDFNVDNIGFVRKEDDFKTELVNGMRNINHKVKNPFDDNIQNIIGLYCVISYTKGKRICEQTEFMSIKEINDIKNMSKMRDYIWKSYFCEMAKKTIIRRACKINFASITKKLDNFDNQFYDLNKPKKTAGLEALNNEK